MQTYSAVQFKGGTGKTTTIMALASTFIEEGKKVVILDLDNRLQIAEWKTECEKHNFPQPIKRPAWPSNLEVIPCADADEAFALQGEYDAKGFDYCLIDTGAGTSSETGRVVFISDLTMVVTKPTALEVAQVFKTLQWLTELGKKNEEYDMPKIKVVITDLETKSKRGVDEERFLNALNSQIPQLVCKTTLTKRKAFSTMLTWGPLGISLAAYLSGKVLQKSQARNFTSALEIAQKLGSELLEVSNG